MEIFKPRLVPRDNEAGDLSFQEFLADFADQQSLVEPSGESDPALQEFLKARGEEIRQGLETDTQAAIGYMEYVSQQPAPEKPVEETDENLRKFLDQQRQKQVQWEDIPPTEQKALQAITRIHQSDRARNLLIEMRTSFWQNVRGVTKRLARARMYRGHGNERILKEVREYLAEEIIDDSSRSEADILKEGTGNPYKEVARFALAHPPNPDNLEDLGEPAETLIFIMGGNAQRIRYTEGRSGLLDSYGSAMKLVQEGKADAAFFRSGFVPPGWFGVETDPTLTYERVLALLSSLLRGQKKLIIDTSSMGAGMTANLLQEAEVQALLKESGVKEITFIMRDPIHHPPTFPPRKFERVPDLSGLPGVETNFIIICQKMGWFELAKNSFIDLDGEVPFSGNGDNVHVYVYGQEKENVSHLQVAKPVIDYGVIISQGKKVDVEALIEPFRSLGALKAKVQEKKEEPKKDEGEKRKAA